MANNIFCMKKHFAFLPIFIFMAIYSSAYSQPTDKMEGAWVNKSEGQKTIILIKDGYFTCTKFSADKFIAGWGGVLSDKDKKNTVRIEFNSSDSENVGKEIELKFLETKAELEIVLNGKKTKFERLGDGKEMLSGTWKITARDQDGKLVPIHQTGARKTLKMLTGGRFQWFAINPETKQFSGTGGGTYSFVNGKYTENIDFFSRDNSRVGVKLIFDGKLEDGKWHHSGLSSKGDKIYEVWERVKY